ncbi:hypothetical protein [Rhizobium leguminosarum]|uniref:hypothetical protein n=1 Tax=Rhizobium leguminosarum TaxID=384 RepID=UPI002E12BC7C|nr:hypothetical protein U8Q02_43580 [Rhizobium leguminosarum]
MRTHFANISRPKSVAKNMKVALSSFVDNVTLGRCQHLTAKLYGYSSWYELQTTIGVEATSLDDGIVDTKVAASRRMDQIDCLVSEGIDYALSVYLVETLHPTRASFDMSLSQAGLMEHMANLAGGLGARRISLFCHEDAEAEIAFYEVERGKLGKDVIRRPALAQAVKAAFGVDHRTVPDYRSKFVIRTGSTDYVWSTMWTNDAASRGADGAVVHHPVALFSAVRNPVVKGFTSVSGQRPEGVWLSVEEAQEHMTLIGRRSWYGHYGE